MNGAPLRDGAILVDAGKIKSLGNKRDLMREGVDEALDFPSHAILPGLVNPHVHLELSLRDSVAIKQQAGADCSFVDWLKQVIAQSPSDPIQLEELVRESTRSGIAQCLRFGVTSVGDITRHAQFSREVLATSPLRAVSFGEVQGMAKRRSLLENRLEIALDDEHQTDRLRIALSPHAPYSVEPNGYRRCLQIARDRRMPLATHLAETPDEAPFLANHSGPFRDLWEWLSGWDENVPRFAGGPIRYAQSLGLLDYPTLLAHVNYCGDQEMEILSRGKSSVVYCPRTHDYFGHPPHRWREMLARGMNVAVGTDSAASSPNLNPVEDLRLLHKKYPEISAEHLWELVTTRAARALGLENVSGMLAPGFPCDAIAFPITGVNPLTEILQSEMIPSNVLIDGEEIAC